ncbi:MAG: 3-keto-disaccharide hydrolase [Planctomycetota bacterium]|jgi:hypothetical protein
MRTPILACALASCILVSCALTEGTSTPSAGWQPLFDGKTLDGWVEAGGRYDGAARWTVEDGCITGREGPNRAGGLIYTANYYRNFVFKCDVWMSYPFDSGIFVRMVPRPGAKGAQVTLDHRPSGEIAGIYSDGWLLHNERIQAKYKRDQWNHFEVRCRGSDMHIEVWMNGEKVTDYRLPQGSKGYAPAGRIGLQVHGSRNDPEGSRVQFKDLYIRELPEYDAAVFECDDRGFLRPTPAAQRAGWRSLFNGTDLTGWEPAEGTTGFAVRNGIIEVLKEGDAQYLRTKEDYRDFELRLDFKIEYMANSGLFLRGNRKGGDPAYSGCEVQILDDFNWEAVAGYKLKPYQFSGGLYAAVAPGAKGLLSLGVWNSRPGSSACNDMRAATSRRMSTRGSATSTSGRSSVERPDPSSLPGELSPR